MVGSQEVVSVCLNTYMRPIVYNCLDSIADQDAVGVTIAIVVSDNDSAASGRSHVERFAQDRNYSVDYRVVPDRNIAIARNDAVARADGEWILFVDDDEVAPPNWVSSMLACARDYEADVVLGAVKARYAPGTPRFIEKLNPMSKHWGRTGKSMTMASTCNTLVRASWFRERGFAFDPRYGRAGCDDADLFYRMHRAGAKIVVCADAPVSEVVPVDRSSIEYLRRRFTRLGQSYATITNRYRSRPMRALFAIEAAVRCGIFGLFFVVSYPVDRSHATGWRLRYWRNKGKLQQTAYGVLQEMY